MTIEVAMPVYRPSGRLEAVLTAFGLQTNKDFYITIYNDTNPDEVEEIKKDEEIVDQIRKRYDLNISMVQNPYNFGYMKNMHQIFERATGDILFLFADDDIISRDCLELVSEAFKQKDVGVVSRPYYWFIDDMENAVRFEGTISKQIKYVDILNNSDNNMIDIWRCISAAGQLSGLAFRREYLHGMPYEEDMFTAHIYPFLYIFSKYKCAYMPHPTVAVSIATSQCHTDIYDPSPLEQWVKMYYMILEHSKYDVIKEFLVRKITSDYYGLAQIKNYGTFTELMTEIKNYIRFNKKNIINPQFYLFSIGSILCPKFILRNITEWYKLNILSKRINTMDINYDIFPIKEIENLWNNPKKNERIR